MLVLGAIALGGLGVLTLVLAGFLAFPFPSLATPLLMAGCSLLAVSWWALLVLTLLRFWDES